MNFRRMLLNIAASLRFPGSAEYWDLRYRLGENSGLGSYGEEANYKRDFINQLIARHGVASVIDFGCGDGNQLEGLRLQRYAGFDVSPAALALCRKRHGHRDGWSFANTDSYSGFTADASFSLDVLYHLVEDDVYKLYLERLFDAATSMVIVYSSNNDSSGEVFGRHVRHRRFSDWVSECRPQFHLIESPARPSTLPRPGPYAASFWVFKRFVK